MNICEIKKYDIANGKGVRTSIFVAGCEHYCTDCFNKDIWDFNSGEKFTNRHKEKIIKNVGKDIVSGLSILGGEPLHPKNISEIMEITKNVKERYPEKDIWLWSGYTIEELSDMYDLDEVLKYIDFLIDGRFKKEEQDISLKYRGSRNQRIIKINEENLKKYKK